MNIAPVGKSDMANLLKLIDRISNEKAQAAESVPKLEAPAMTPIPPAPVAIPDDMAVVESNSIQAPLGRYINIWA